MDQAAEPVLPQNPDTSARGGRILAPGRRVLMQRPVRPVHVAVVGVLAEDQPQVPFASDQHPVRALAPGACDPAFGYSIRARRLDRYLYDPHADRGEHCVERRGELRIPVPDQELQAVCAALEVYQQVAGLLGHPRADGVGGDPARYRSRAPAQTVTSRAPRGRPPAHLAQPRAARGRRRRTPGKGAARSLWGPRTSSMSCDQAVLVDHATDANVSSDTVLLKIDRFGVAVSAGQRSPVTGAAGAGCGGSRARAGSAADGPGSR